MKSEIVKRPWLVYLLTIVLALAGCSDDDGGNGSTSDGGGSGGTSGYPAGQGLPATTGNASADKLVKAADDCDYQSPNTVPAGWKMVPIGKKGCVVWAPPGWTAQGAGTEIVSVQEDSAGNTGYLAMMGTPAAGVSVTCTPRGATDFVSKTIDLWGCKNVKSLYYKEGYETVAGISIPKADVIFSCSTGGVTKVGYMWVTIQGSSPLCNLLILGLWMLESQITAKTCTLTQVLLSAQCPKPGGGFCVDASCNADCVKAGHKSGKCDSNDHCVCN